MSTCSGIVSRLPGLSECRANPIGLWNVTASGLAIGTSFAPGPFEESAVKAHSDSYLNRGQGESKAERAKKLN